jgi:hypothetical protein
MCIYLYILVALFAVPVQRQRNQSLIQYSGSCLDNGWTLDEVFLEAISSSFFLFYRLRPYFHWSEVLATSLWSYPRLDFFIQVLAKGYISSPRGGLGGEVAQW